MTPVPACTCEPCEGALHDASARLPKDAFGVGFALESLEESLTGWLRQLSGVVAAMKNVSSDAVAIGAFLRG